jgi:hypothetical protein
MRGRIAGMSEPSPFNEHERPTLRNTGPYVPKKDPPILGLWPLLLVTNLVLPPLIYWEWKYGTFWTGPKSEGSLLLGLIACDLIFLYCAIRDRIKQR